jgi:hypothetical protein
MIGTLPTHTLIHVVLSLLGIFSGLIAVGGLMAGARFHRWIDVFLATTVLTSITGFGFPFGTLLPSHIVGGLSLVVLAAAIAALYWKRLSGPWRSAFVALSVLALYLNCSFFSYSSFRRRRSWPSSRQAPRLQHSPPPSCSFSYSSSGSGGLPSKAFKPHAAWREHQELPSPRARGKPSENVQTPELLRPARSGTAEYR